MSEVPRGAGVEGILPFPRGLQRVMIGAVRFARAKPLGAAGAISVFVLCVLALFAPYLSQNDPNELHLDESLSGPSGAFWLGSDHLGRDLFSRVVHGARISLAVGLISTLVGATSGAIIGVFGAYYRGWIDNVTQRLMDVLMSFPTLVLALAVLAVLGSSLTNVIVAISIPIIPRASRVVRSSALAIRETQYLDAARALGATDVRLIVRHIMPNCAAPYLIIATAQLGNAILTEASMSFLGLGVPPPTATWGGMLSGEARRFFEVSPWMAVPPGIAIGIAVFGFNLLGDALRDVWDPKLRNA